MDMRLHASKSEIATTMLNYLYCSTIALLNLLRFCFSNFNDKKQEAVDQELFLGKSPTPYSQ